MAKNLIYSSLICLVFCGCYNSQKASKKLERIAKKNPEKVALMCSVSFPCYSKSDTVVVTEYDFIEVLDTINHLKTDTITDTIIKTMVKKRTVMAPKQVIYITKYVKDSAKIASLENQLRECTEGGAKKEEKTTNFPKILSLLLAILCLVVYFVAKKK